MVIVGSSFDPPTPNPSGRRFYHSRRPCEAMPTRDDGETDDREGRRSLPKAVGAVSALAAAGCLGDGGGTPTSDGTDTPTNGTDTPTDGGTGTPGKGTDRGDGGTDEQTPTPEPVTPWHRDHDWEIDETAATNWDNYEVTRIFDQPEFMDIELAPDGRLFYITRGHGPGTGGSTEETFRVGHVDPDTGADGILLEKETFTATPGSSATDTPSRETGGQGIALDPDFQDNGYVYVLYHPRLEAMDDIGPSPYDQFWDGEVERFGYVLLSRFELVGAELDPDSETEIIRIPQQYDSCCHHGGALDFGPEGNVWISVGDNSEVVSPYSSIDDREGRHPAYDAGRTASNTADLRGSVLRITPGENGGYSVPEGNLKDVHEERTGEEYSEEAFRPAIFSMGYRNPYQVCVDSHTGALFTATYSPGYGSWSDPPERGPPGIAGYRLICEPDYAGWPYFQGYYPYRRYDHETGEVGQPYWPDNPRNDSRNNTGLEYLPPYEPDLVWQPQNGQDTLEHYEPPLWADVPRPGEVTWPDLGGSGGNNAGPAYRYSEAYGETAIPPFFEGKQFFLTSYGSLPSIRYLDFGGRARAEVSIGEFLPDAPWVGDTPHHLRFGPEGRAFVTNYGDGFYMVEYRG
jgi:glucose/arabinose dehydrogenase